MNRIRNGAIRDMNRKLFGNECYQSCEFCAKAKPSADEKILYCSRKGIVQPENKCWRFSYDPLRRKPRTLPDLPSFDPEEFSL